MAQVYKNKQVRETTLLKEDVISAISNLKKLRKRYDTPESREFFEKVKNITDYNISGFDKVFRILETEYPEMLSNLDKSYIKQVKEYTIQIYKLYLKECILSDSNNETVNKNDDIDFIISVPEAIKFRKEAFYMGVNFLFSGLIINDEEELFRAYEELTKRLKKLHILDRMSIVSFILIFVFAIINKIRKDNDIKNRKIYAGLAIFTLISGTLYTIIEFFNNRRIKKAKQNVNLI